MLRPITIMYPVIPAKDEAERAPQTDRPHFPAEYVALVNHDAQMPADLVLETLDTFTRKVKPDLDELVGRTSR